MLVGSVAVGCSSRPCPSRDSHRHLYSHRGSAGAGTLSLSSAWWRRTVSTGPFRILCDQRVLSLFLYYALYAIESPWLHDTIDSVYRVVIVDCGQSVEIIPSLQRWDFGLVLVTYRSIVLIRIARRPVLRCCTATRINTTAGTTLTLIFDWSSSGFDDTNTMHMIPRSTSKYAPHSLKICDFICRTGLDDRNTTHMILRSTSKYAPHSIKMRNFIRRPIFDRTCVCT